MLDVAQGGGAGGSKGFGLLPVLFHPLPHRLGRYLDVSLGSRCQLGVHRF